MDNSDDEIGFRRKEEPRERSEATDKAKEVELQAMLGRSMTKEPSNPRDQLASRGPAPQQPDQPPLVPERHERPMFSHSQTIREEGAMTSLDNQIKKEMPDTVKTRLLLIKIAFFLNLLFLLIFFPTTMYSPLSSLLRQINDLSGRLSSAFAFPAYLAMEVLNLLVSLFIYASCTDLRRTLIKCSIGVLIVVAVVNLIIGIVVYSQSGGKKENFEGMTANEQLRFDSDVNKYTFYTTNMILIGLYMIVELVVFLIMAFLVFLLSSVLEADSYKPRIGRKPFTRASVIRQSEIEKWMTY